MTEKLQQVVKRELEKLPPESRDAINTIDWGKITEEIVSEYFWREEDINDIQAEILVVLLGLEDPSLLGVHLENNIGATTEEAKNISEEVFRRIFVPISQKLQENIIKSGKMENADWQKNLDFILSGGDFTTFIDKAPAEEEK